MDQAGHKEREHFFRAAKMMSLVTLLSRIFGMYREGAVAWLGTSRLNDAFGVAFNIPNLFRRLFGEGALSAAFVPAFTETNEKGGFDKARKLLANTLGLLAVFLTGLTVMIEIGLQIWVAYWPAADRQFLVWLLQIMMPYMIFVCLLGLGSGALNCKGHFFYPAVAPILLNIIMILAADVIAPLFSHDLVFNLNVLSWSVTFAGVVQLAILLWLLKRNGFTLRLKLWPLEPGTRQIFKMLVPALLGVGMLQLSSLFDMVVLWGLTATKDSQQMHFLGFSFAKPLVEGVVVRYNAANRLYQFPLGVLATSLGVAVFPLLTRYASRNDLPNFRDSLNRALRLSMMEAMATATGLFMLATPIIRLIFQHRDFHQVDTEQAAFLLKTYLLGIWAMATYQIFARAFYSFKDMTTPPKVLGRGVLMYVTLVLALMWMPVRWLPEGFVPLDPRVSGDQRLGAGAFGVALAITWSINTLILAWKLRQRLGVFGGRKLAYSVGRTLICCGIMAEVLMILRWQLERHRIANSMLVAICVLVGAATFLVAARVLKAPELGELLGAMGKKNKNATGPGESGKIG